MMLSEEGIIQGEDGLYYEQEGSDDEMVLEDIITAEDYINDEEEDKARRISNQQFKD